MTPMAGIKSLAKCFVYRSLLILKLYQFRKTSGFLFSPHLLKADKSRKPAGGFLSQQTVLGCILGWYFSSTLQILVSKILAGILELFQMRWCDNKKKILARLSCLPLISARLPLLSYWRGEAIKITLYSWGFLQEDDFCGCCVRKLLCCFFKGEHGTKKGLLEENPTLVWKGKFSFSLCFSFSILIPHAQDSHVLFSNLTINHSSALRTSNCFCGEPPLWLPDIRCFIP